MLLSKVKKILMVLIPLLVAIISVVVWQLLDMKRFHESPEVHEVPVTVTGIKQMKNVLLEVSGSAVASDPENADNYVLRLQHLYAEKVDVSVLKETGDTYLLSSRDLKPGDLLIENPETIQSGQAILPVSGVDDSRIINLIIKACIAATTEKKRDDLFRFVSTEYMDSLGFNRMFMGRFVHRIFEELETLDISLAEDPKPFINGENAKVMLKLRIRAFYMDRQNYVLGDAESPNEVIILFRKTKNAWKIISADGFKPLGFDEKYLRLLGGRFDLPLSDQEKLERDRRCMPCRQKMSERFGPYDE